MEEITIREAVHQDLPVIADFQLRMAVESEGISLDKEILSRGIQAVFEDKTRGTYFVTEIDGMVVASLMVTYEWSDWRNGVVLWIQSVYVVPSRRRSGIFHRMYLHLKKMAEELPHVTGLRLYVDNQNLAAQAVYERIGMNGGHYRVFEWMKHG